MSIVTPCRPWLLAAALLASACWQPNPKTTGPPATAESHYSRLNVAEATELAVKDAARQGRDLQQYHPAVVSFSWQGTEGTWWVHFNGRVSMPGNHFAIAVDDATGTMQLHAGR